MRERDHSLHYWRFALFKIVRLRAQLRRIVGLDCACHMTAIEGAQMGGMKRLILDFALALFLIALLSIVLPV
jgi:hypothetical protein